MKKLLNFVVFQAVWFAAVWGASAGNIWLGLAAAGISVLIHMFMLERGDHFGRELALIVGFGIVGSFIDSQLYLAGLLSYPTSANLWMYPTVPPWIAALWFATAVLPRFSLAWLSQALWLAPIAGAIGGPVSFLAGRRLGVLDSGESFGATMVILSIEYAVLTTLLLYAHSRWVLGGHSTEVASGVDEGGD